MVSPQGQSTAKKRVFGLVFFFSSSLPSLHTDDITLQSAFPSSNSSRRNIPATHNQNYQAPSPRRQPTPPLKWKPKPRAFSPCEEGADDKAASVPGRRTRCVAREARCFIQLTLGLLSLHTFAWGMFIKGSGCFLDGTSSFCSVSDQETQSLAEATGASPTPLEKGWSPPSAPPSQLPTSQKNKT